MRKVACLVVCAGCVLSMPAKAQVSAERASDALEMVANLDLGLNAPVSPLDYTMAMHLMDMALELDPTDADLARSVVEAAWLAADHEQLIEATRAVVRNDPSDTVAQLRLISAIVNREQTVEARIAAYTRFIDQGAESIDASVRSRLSLDMALLERERGNETEFLSALRKSAKLDPTNKEAQSLVAQHYSLRIKESSTRMRLQMRLLYADPLDPHVHIAIARLAASEGATDVAWRFLNNGISIFQIDAGIVPNDLQEQRLSLMWQQQGPQSILDELNPSLADRRATNQTLIDARIEADEPYDDIPMPDELRYSPGTDRIRLLAAYILEDQSTVDSVLRDLELTLVANYETLEEQMRVRGSNKGLLIRGYLQEVATYQTMRAIVGISADDIQQDITRIIGDVPEFQRMFEPFEAFSLYASGKYELARSTASESLEESAPRDLIIALCTQALGERDEAIEQFEALTHEYPLQATGAIARSILSTLTDDSDQITDEGNIMREIGDGIPLWIDKMITLPENTMRLSVKSIQRQYDAGERSTLELTLANLSSIPLSMGNSQPIDSSFLVVPGFREDGGDFQGFGRGKVLDLSRRLRLNPLEEFRVLVDPDAIQTSWLLDSQPQTAIRQRWRVLQGFKALASGGILNSPFSLVSETPIVERSVLGEIYEPVDGLLDAINSDNPSRFMNGVMAVNAIMLKPETRSDLTDADIESFVNALADRYARSDTSTKIWMLGKLPTKLACPPIKAFDDRVQQDMTAESLINPEQESAHVAMVLMTRVESMSSPMFDVASGHPDPRIVWIGDRIRQRIDGVKPMYAGTENPFEMFAPQVRDD